MEKRNKLLLNIIILTILYLLVMTYFYYDYSKSLNSYNSEIYEGYETLQNVIHKVHNEDSELYKTLLSEDILTTKMTRNSIYAITNHSTSIITDLLDLEYNSHISSQMIASTIDEYYSLENLRTSIIEIHRANLLSSDNIYDDQIDEMIEEYENQINVILLDIHQEIELNKIKNLDLINGLKSSFLIKEIFLFMIYLVSMLIIFYISDLYKEFLKTKENELEENILDKDMQEILSFVKKQVALGNFPTIKELKLHLNISHPTLLVKLDELQKKNLISLKKKGRNKHLFIK